MYITCTTFFFIRGLFHASCSTTCLSIKVGGRRDGKWSCLHRVGMWCVRMVYKKKKRICKIVIKTVTTDATTCTIAFGEGGSGGWCVGDMAICQFFWKIKWYQKPFSLLLFAIKMLMDLLQISTRHVFYYT